MAAIDPCEYEEITIQSDQGFSVDLRLGVVSFQYFEDLFSPTITAKMVIVSTSGVVSSDKTKKIESLYNGLPIRGGEKVTVKIKGNSKRNKGLQFNTEDTFLYVSSISNVIRDGQKEIFVLNLVSKEAITNELTHVTRRFDRDVPIDDNVKDILKNDLKVKPSRFKGQVDRTSNKFGFIGNLKKPFQILVWLAAKSAPQMDTKPMAGYFFYQTKRGFNFRSIESLIEEGKTSITASEMMSGKKVGAKAVYTHKQYTDRINESGDDNILVYSVKRNNDLLRKLILGQYSSYVQSFDPYRGTFSKKDEGIFSLKDIIRDKSGKKGKLKTLGERPEVPAIVSQSGEDLGQLPSKIVTLVNDVGTLSKKASTQTNSEMNLTQRQVLLRYNLLFQQVVSVIVPLNTEICVGDIVKFKFLGTPEGETYDRQQSGSYMIKELCHAFDPEQSVTSMTVVRDTFGELSAD
tara:strand:+ start:3036 stop:4418 length:1383 start_codon:yes stop_codon:yes gene_type:complete